MTNHEKYFGTPDLAARSTYDDEFMNQQTIEFKNWINSKLDIFEVACLDEKKLKKEYTEWLNMEVETHD